ncbi:hypothetical protein A9Q83_08920 [Alphaproteobacteria bacterium 46_93_T64]|nr:hypothetical protein A9Q83_08920 [Alphaproteobacteria bacterium 46_93_T64]
MKVLLLEDDEDDFIIAADLLSEIYGSDLTLDWVSQKEQALQYVQENDYDVLLFDQFLGKTQGLDVIREINELTTISAPMILLTGLDDREIDIQAMNAGATDYLVKQKLDESVLERSIRYSLKQKKAEQEIEHMAYHDALTGLPNRLLFMQHLTWSFEMCKRRNKSSTVLFIDLDNFKTINDTLGHSAGDQLLVHVANRIKSSLRAEDLVARFGGDEFVILLNQIDEDPDEIQENAKIVVDKIQAALREPVTFDGQPLVITPSIGGVNYPKPADTPESVIKYADTAMYNVKSAGRDSFTFFSAEMGEAIQQQHQMETKLRFALVNQEFHLVFQPILDMKNMKIVSAEALIRWENPELGNIPPLDFIPIAEKSNTIIEIGEWVITEAIENLALLPDLPCMSINVSMKQFKATNLVNCLKQSLSKHQIEPNRILLEVTESIFVDDIEMTIAKMNELRSLGISFALDDFGTGFSSLTQLKHLPIDILKIDKSFISELTLGNKNSAIVKSVILLGNELNIKVIGEGVEDESQKDFLIKHGTDLGQGYLFSKPKKIEEFSEFCKTL